MDEFTVNEGLQSISGMEDLYKIFFLKFLGWESKTDDTRSTSDGLLYFFTVPKSSSITNEDLKHYWGDEFMESILEDGDDWSTPLGTAGIAKRILKRYIMDEAKNTAMSNFGDPEFAEEAADNIGRKIRFFYSARDEEWTAAYGMASVSKLSALIASKKEEYNSYCEI